MLKLCVPSLYNSRAALCLDILLMFGKKVILFQFIKKCQPVSLLPICRKLLEKTYDQHNFDFTDTRIMLSVHQSRFCHSGACMHQLISIVHDIYNAFDSNPALEVRGVFLDISKTFDRVWHKEFYAC